MARKNRTPEENARREKIRELLQMANIGSMDDIQNLFKETIAEFMENGLEAELDEDLGYSRYDYKNKATDNSRNGHSSKTLRTSFGDVEVSVPRDRKGEFEPQVLKKGQTSISQDVEEKILSMYAKGMTTSDIEAHIQDIYGISVSDSTISRITDKILPIAKEWQQRPLESIYAVVFLDAIHYHVRSEGQIVKKAVYIAIGIDLDGRKDVLGMWVGENESAKFWATVLNGCKRPTKQCTCQAQSPSEKIVPWSGCVFLRPLSKIHAPRQENSQRRQTWKREQWQSGKNNGFKPSPLQSRAASPSKSGVQNTAFLYPAFTSGSGK